MRFSTPWHITGEPQGMPGLSINWGAWSEIGAARGQVGERVKMKGMETIAPQQGIRLLEQLFWGAEGPGWRSPDRMAGIYPAVPDWRGSAADG